MSTFRLVVSSPDGNVWEGDAYMLTVRGIEGELAVMAGHVPFVTAIKPCRCKIELEDGTELYGEADGGILTVSGKVATLLSGTFQMIDE